MKDQKFGKKILVQFRRFLYKKHFRRNQYILLANDFGYTGQSLTAQLFVFDFANFDKLNPPKWEICWEKLINIFQR